MALIRQVRRHENSHAWAYVEWSDENPHHFEILGGKEFMHQQEAVDWSKGFAIDSYEWVEPDTIKVKRLLIERRNLEKRLEEVNNELSPFQK